MYNDQDYPFFLPFHIWTLCNISGVFCNHYFLQMLSNLSRGQHESVYNTGETLTPFGELKEKVVNICAILYVL